MLMLGLNRKKYIPDAIVIHKEQNNEAFLVKSTVAFGNTRFTTVNACAGTAVFRA
jgi:hypothetical protein